MMLQYLNRETARQILKTTLNIVCINKERLFASIIARMRLDMSVCVCVSRERINRHRKTFKIAISRKVKVKGLTSASSPRDFAYKPSYFPSSVSIAQPNASPGDRPWSYIHLPAGTTPISVCTSILDPTFCLQYPCICLSRLSRFLAPRSYTFSACSSATKKPF